MRGAIVALVFVVSGCNGILGWDAATISPDETGAQEAGDVCHRYCDAMFANCGTGNNLKYITPDVCLKICSKMDLGAEGDVKGNSSSCRLHFALLAKDDPSNCEAAGPLGTGACIADDKTRCNAFCVLDCQYCDCTQSATSPDGGTNTSFVYAGDDDCNAACAGYPPFTPNTRITDDENQNTLNCRLYHLQAAYVDDPARTTHCPHTRLKSATCR